MDHHFPQIQMNYKNYSIEHALTFNGLNYLIRLTYYAQDVAIAMMLKESVSLQEELQFHFGMATVVIKLVIKEANHYFSKKTSDITVCSHLQFNKY